MIHYCTTITSPMIRANRETVFLFGDNTWRTGLGGLAKICRGEPNCHGIATKWSPENHWDSFFDDRQWDSILPILASDLNKLKFWLDAERKVVVPPLGIGLAKMDQKAPRLYQYMQERLHSFASIYGETQEGCDEALF